MNKEELKHKLEANGLGKYYNELVPIFRNTIRLHPNATTEANIKPGQTKIGGTPHLPAHIEWPTATTIRINKKTSFFIFTTKTQETVTLPLSFIAQINLAEVSRYDTEKLLPSSGILYFFYTAEQDAWGFDYADKDKFRVIYHDGDTGGLTNREFPDNLPEDAQFSPTSVNIEQQISLPDEHEVYNNFTDDESDTFWDEIRGEDNINKLLGYSDNVQNPMELECELVTNGLYCGNSTGYNNPLAKELEPNAKDWQLLLQIDSNDENNMMWGDCGRLYFWIKKQDLLDKNFDKTWLILQCC